MQYDQNENENEHEHEKVYIEMRATCKKVTRCGRREDVREKGDDKMRGGKCT